MTQATNLLFDNVVKLIEQAKKHVNQTIDLTMCVTYYEIGRMIVEEEQQGKARAKYGISLLKELSTYLTERFGNGYSVRNLQNARIFFLIYLPVVNNCAEKNTTLENIKDINNNEVEIWQTLSAKFKLHGIKRYDLKSIKPFSKERIIDANNSYINGIEKQQTVISKLENIGNARKNALFSSIYYPFKVSWSHYLILMRIKNEQERSFYEIETARENWSVRQLQRQYNSSLYERLALSRDKDEVMQLATHGQEIQKPTDMLKSPYVLDFLGLCDSATYRESELENAIISKLQSFLLELGKGFLFEARQKRFTFDEDHFYVDLVFYNRLLQCYVLIDIKTDKLKHQDLGQMQMYVNYYDSYMKTDFEKPTIGILLCKEKNESIVRLTLPKDANIYATEYMLYLPNKDLLQQKLSQWIKEYNDEKNSITMTSLPLKRKKSEISATGGKKSEISATDIFFRPTSLDDNSPKKALKQ